MKRIIVIAAAAATLFVAGCGGQAANTAVAPGAPSDHQVVSDLDQLLSQSNASYDSVASCVHKQWDQSQDGWDQYVCQVAMSDGKPVTVRVTDDAQSVNEEGINLNPPTNGPTQ